MVMEIYDETLVESMKYYESGADMPFNFGLVFMNDTCGGICTTHLIAHWISNMPEDKWPNFVVRKNKIFAFYCNFIIHVYSYQSQLKALYWF